MSIHSQTLSTHHSFWIRQRPVHQRFKALAEAHKTEIAVIGAGLAGFSTAIELLDRGYQVTVLEALVVGAGTSAASTGHLDAHPERGAKTLIDAIGEESAREVTRLRLEAIDQIERRSNNSCDFKRISAFQYSENKRDQAALHEDMEAANVIGLHATWSKRLPLPFDTIGYEIGRMGRFQSMEYLECLLQIFLEKGGKIFERSIVSAPVGEHPTKLRVGTGSIQFEQLVVAVHCNYSDVMRIYLQTPAYQSYVLAARVKNAVPDALFWDNSDPYFYTRLATSGDPGLIIVGGCDHRTGVGDSLEAEKSLQQYVHNRYEVEEIVCKWSAELYEPVDGLPIIGRVPGKKNVWIATGFSGIGLTWGPAAAKLIADQIHGKPTLLENELSPSRFGVGGLLIMVQEQMASIANFAERILPETSVDVNDLQQGEGKVGNVDGKFTAVCRDKSGNLHMHNPRCVHMGGVVHWNAAEQSWDCPVHGGRYAACGTRIYSPPEADLLKPEEKPHE